MVIENVFTTPENVASTGLGRIGYIIGPNIYAILTNLTVTCNYTEDESVIESMLSEKDY